MTHTITQTTDAKAATKAPKMIYDTLSVAKMLRGKMEKQHPGTTFDIVHVTTGYQIVRVTKGAPSAMFGKPAPITFTTKLGIQLTATDNLATEQAAPQSVFHVNKGEITYFTLSLTRTTGSWYYFSEPVGLSKDKWVHKNHVVSIAKEGEMHKFAVPTKIAKAKGYIAA